MGKAKPVIDRNRCKGCELCVFVCPVKILTMGDSYNKRGVSYPFCVDDEKCTGCRACAIICGDLAIEIEVKA